MNDTEIERRLQEEPFFINIRRYNYDLRVLEQVRYPEGAPTHVIAQALKMTEAQVVQREAEITEDLKDKMGARE